MAPMSLEGGNMFPFLLFSEASPNMCGKEEDREYIFPPGLCTQTLKAGH